MPEPMRMMISGLLIAAAVLGVALGPLPVSAAGPATTVATFDPGRVDLPDDIDPPLPGPTNPGGPAS